MSRLHKKLAVDFTLFNLNDPETTNFYVKNIDYLITNFPYFQDIELLTAYFIAGNTKFVAKFRTCLGKFIEIIHYEGIGAASCTQSTNDLREVVVDQPGTHDDSQEGGIGCFYPSDESDEDKTGNIDGDSEPADANAPEDCRDNLQDKTGNIDGDSELADANAPEDCQDNLQDKSYSISSCDSEPRFPNHFPEGKEFTRHSTAVVMKYYARVLQCYAGDYQVTPCFVKALITKLEYDSIHHLLVGLLQEGTILPILVEARCVPRIITKNLKSLAALLDGVLYSSRNNIEDEEDFIDQVAMHKGMLIERFLQIGMAFGYIDGEAYGPCSDEEASAGGKAFTSDEDEYFKSNSTTPDNSSAEAYTEDSGPVPENTSESSGTAPQMEEPEQMPSDDVAYDTQVTQADAQNDPLKYSTEFSTIYKVLHMICMNRNSINIRSMKITAISRFTLFYIRLLSYNASVHPALVAPLIDFFFLHTSNTHLQASVLRILVKTPTKQLKSLGLFDSMFACCHSHISAIKSTYSSTGRVDGLFSFLIRLYIRYASFIRTEYPTWDVFHGLMEAPCGLEKAKYRVEDLDLLLEYEGFERYIIESMLSVLPYPLIFENKKEASDAVPKDC